MFKEFKEFAMKGNVIDLAIGVIIGAAFGKVVTSIVNDVLMPPIGKLTGGVNFSDLFVNLDPAKTLANGIPVRSLADAKAAGAAIIAYGQFINTAIDFLIVAVCVFMLVKAVNSMKKKPAPAAPAPPTRDQKLLAEIRDLLAEKQPVNRLATPSLS